jgi:glycosyltransferase involved in cell wall biosynthesis
MLVSVIIPGYNHAPYLRERIESVLNQEYPDFEVILLDDCSTDNSAEIMQAYASGKYSCKGREVRFVGNERNSGNTFKQWAKGMSLAKGEYIWIAESDDVAEPSFLRECMARLLANPDAVVAFTWSDMIGPDSKVLDCSWDETWRYKAPGVYEGGKFCLHRLVYKNLMYNASMIVFRKDAYKKVTSRYMKFRHSGDWLFWFEMCIQGKVCEVPLKLNKFRQHLNKVSNASRSSGQDFEEMAEIQTIISEALHLCLYNRRCLRGRQTKRIDKALRNSPDETYVMFVKSMKEKYPLIYGGSGFDKFVYTIDKVLNLSRMNK